MPRHWVWWALGVVVALLVARWVILVPLLLPGVILLRVLELLPRSFTDKLVYYLAPQAGTAANLVIAAVVIAAHDQDKCHLPGAPPPLPPLEVFGFLLLFLTASTGFVFVARAFRRPYAAAIGVAYYPLMITALVGFGIGLGGGI